MADVGKLNIDINVNTSNLNRNLSQVENRLTAFNNKINRQTIGLTDNFKGLNNALLSISNISLGGLTNGLSNVSEEGNKVASSTASIISAMASLNNKFVTAEHVKTFTKMQEESKKANIALKRITASMQDLNRYKRESREIQEEDVLPGARDRISDRRELENYDRYRRSVLRQQARLRATHFSRQVPQIPSGRSLREIIPAFATESQRERILGIRDARQQTNNSSQGAQRGINSLNNSLRGLATGFMSSVRAGDFLGGIMSILTSKAGLLATVLITVATATFKLAMIGSDAREAMNKFYVTMGSMTSQAEAFASKMGSLGLSTGEVKAVTADFYGLTRAMGLSKEEAYTLSTALIKRSYDIASLNNVDAIEVQEAMKSGIEGMSMPMRKYGSVILEETVQQHAWQKGIAKVNTELTEQQKVLARASKIMSDTAGSEGDLKETNESTANSLRHLNSQWEELSKILGRAFEPLWNSVIKFTSSIMPILKDVAISVMEIFNEVYIFLNGLGGAIAGLYLQITGQGMEEDRGFFVGLRKGQETARQFLKDYTENVQKRAKAIEDTIDNNNKEADAAAKKAAEDKKALKEAKDNLQSFDEIHKLEKDLADKDKGKDYGPRKMPDTLTKDSEPPAPPSTPTPPTGGSGGIFGPMTKTIFLNLAFGPTWGPIIQAAGAALDFILGKSPINLDIKVNNPVPSIQSVGSAIDNVGQRSPVPIDFKIGEVKVPLDAKSQDLDNWITRTLKAISKWASDFDTTMLIWSLNTSTIIEKTTSKNASTIQSSLLAINTNTQTWSVTNKGVLDLWSTNTQSTISTWSLKTKSVLDLWTTDTAKTLNSWVEGAKEPINTWTGETEEGINKWSVNTKSVLDLWNTDTSKTISEWANKNTEPINTWTGETEEGINKWSVNSKSVLDLWDTNTSKNISSWATTNSNNVKSFTDNTAGNFSTWSTNVDKNVADVATNSSSNISLFVNSSSKGIADWSNNTRTNINTFAKEADGTLNEWGASSTKTFDNFLTTTDTATTSWAESSINTIGNWATQAYNALSSLATSVGSSITSGFTWTAQKVKSAWSGLGEWVNNNKSWLAPTAVAGVAVAGIAATLLTGGAAGPAAAGGVAGAAGLLLMPDIQAPTGIPQMARGGIVNRSTIANIGEAGPEMIVPLENTSFVDKLASAVGNAVINAMSLNQGASSNGNSEFVMNVDGRELARVLAPKLEKEQKRIGNAIIVGR